MEAALIRIIIVDDHPIVLEGMENIFRNMAGIELVAKASSAMMAISLMRTLPVDIVITDINMPEISGIDLCRKISQEFPQVRVIAMSTYQDKAYISEMIRNGASAYLTKSASFEEIEHAIRATMKGEIHIQLQRSINEQLPQSPTQVLLTRREKEVLLLIAEGLTNKEIADKLFVSQSTIDSHRKNLLSKFDVLNAASLIAHAAKSGLL